MVRLAVGAAVNMAAVERRDTRRRETAAGSTAGSTAVVERHGKRRGGVRL